MNRDRYAFVARMPDEPGALHRAAEVLKRHRGNIERIQYDQRIDANTVFFEIGADDETYREAMDELEGMGYLRLALPVPAYLKLDVWLPNVPGSLFDLLEHVTASGSNIAYLDYDETAPRGEPLRLAVVLEDGSRANVLLDGLKARYPLRILEHSSTGEELDRTVFYIRFAQELRPMLEEGEDDFLLEFLNDSNRISQELRRRGEDPVDALRSILDSGKMLRDSVAYGCHDVAPIEVPGGMLHCIQFPCGGNAYLIDAGARLLVDTGFGSYHAALEEALATAGTTTEELDAVLITHADADHCGSAGRLRAPVWMSEAAWRVLQQGDRSYGSGIEGSMLESFYTRMISLFSDFRPPEDFNAVGGGEGEIHGLPVKGRMRFSGLECVALSGLGGHQEGQVFFLFPSLGLLFSGDSLINFASLDDESREYMTLAKVLMTTVNVDSAKAKREREGLLDLAARWQEENGRPLLICPGHGDPSVLEEGSLRSMLR